jgi:hypothetical protein
MPRPRRLENSLDIRRLAFIGAQARLAELNVERQAILKAFPELSRRNPNGAGTATVPTPKDARPGRRRRKMSAEGRRRIAEAAKRRWAEWRKQNRQS